MLVNFYNFGDKDSYPSRDLLRNPPYESSAKILKNYDVNWELGTTWRASANKSFAQIYK